jgi:hypothetical protein
MADISLGNVSPGAASNVEHGIAGGTIAAGQPLRLDASGNLVPAQADAAGTATCKGLALHDAIVDQPIAYLDWGPIDVTSGVTIGTVYVVSAAAAGGIAPVADLVSTNVVSVIGVGTAAGTILVQLINSAALVP